MRKFYIVAILFCVACCNLFAQEAQQAAMERIRNSTGYRYGESRSVSQDEAREQAEQNLVAKLKTVLAAEGSLTLRGGQESLDETITAVTVGVIENRQEIMYRDGADWVCMQYVHESDLAKAESERQQLVHELIDYGRKQEEQLNISEALKYYTWALRVLNLFHDRISIDTNSGSSDAKAWLSAHLPAMLRNITLSIPAEKIAEDPKEYDRYMVNVQATYAGRPVGMLDVSYFNGEREVSPVHFKNGEGVLPFHDLSAMKNIDLRIIYDYPQEGRNYAPTLAVTYPKGFKRMTFDESAGVRLPIKMKADNLAATESVAAQPAPVTDAGASAGDATTPLYKAPRTTIDRNFEQNAAHYTAAMQAVEQAIRSRDYQSVREYFTGEGFKLFELMMGSGTVSVVKREPVYRVESSAGFVVGKSIPVAIKTGKHVSKENIVFRFETDGGKIKSVAYALTERAENDIFRDGAQWSPESRYSLLQFMEDYQTAYALKRLDYIESIFSDNAVIIVGNMKPSVKKRFYGAGEMASVNLDRNVTYTTYNKDSYMQKLKEDFRRKSFIQLVFEDTYISKVGGTEGYVDNEVLWIELKQNYYSPNYSDKGYLALQLNLRPSGSLINVRTWTPYFVPMDQLKASFPIGNN